MHDALIDVAANTTIEYSILVETFDGPSGPFIHMKQYLERVEAIYASQSGVKITIPKAASYRSDMLSGFVLPGRFQYISNKLRLNLKTNI